VVAAVGVDLDAGDFADRHGIETLCQMIDVGWNDQPADGDFVANRLRRQLFSLGDPKHLGGDRALTSEKHLSSASHAELPSTVRTGEGSVGVISARAHIPGPP